MWLLANWKIVITAVVVAVLAYGAHYIDVTLLEKRQASALLDQIASDVATCQKDQVTTGRAYEALQDDRNRIAAKLSNQLQQPQACVPVAGTSPVRQTGKQHAGSHGLSSQWLYKYSAECETYRSELIVCDKFLDDERR